MSETLWNHKPCKAVRVRAVVAKPAGRIKTVWYAKYSGTIRDVVRVEQDGKTFYLDNHQGIGWIKVTEGRGGCYYPHAAIEIEREVEDEKKSI